MPKTKIHKTDSARAMSRVKRVIESGGSRKTILLSADATRNLRELRELTEIESDVMTIEYAIESALKEARLMTVDSDSA